MFYSCKDNMVTKVYSSTELTELVHDTIKYYEKRVEELKEKNEQLYADAKSAVRKDYEKQIDNLKERLTTGTGIGTMLNVVYPICGESKNITDTSVW